jgi:hypothetical protein
MSKLAAALAALVAAYLGGQVTDLNVPPNVQVAAAGAVSVVGASLFPAWTAQFDEAKAQLASVVALLVGLALDYLIIKVWHLPPQTELLLLGALNGVLSLGAPALTLQQASRYRRGAAYDTRPVSRAAVAGPQRVAE